MKSDELAWIAGFLEGEGFFLKETSARGYVRVGIGASSTDRDVLERLLRTVPDSRVHGPYMLAESARGKKPVWRWSIRVRTPTVELAKQIRPLMCRRRQEQIDALLAVAASQPVGPRPRPLPAHGTRTRYAYGCKCDECREAENSYQRRWRQKKRAGQKAAAGHLGEEA
jgi:hypothetical protein